MKINRLVLYGTLVVREKIIDPLRNVGNFGIRSDFSDKVDARSKNQSDERAYSQMFEIAPRNEKHPDGHGSNQQDGTEIRLQDKQDDNRHEQSHIRKESVREIRYHRFLALEIGGKIEDDAQFGKFDRLKGKREERHVDPPLGPIVRNPYEQDCHKQEQRTQKQLLRIFFKKRIWGFGNERERQQSKEHVGNIPNQIEMIVRFQQFSGCHHKGSDLERRVHAHGTYHDHPEDDKPEREKKNRVVNLFHWPLKDSGLREIRHDFRSQIDERALSEGNEYQQNKRAEVQSGELRRNGGADEMEQRMNDPADERDGNENSHQREQRKNDLDKDENLDKFEKNENGEREEFHMREYYKESR